MKQRYKIRLLESGDRDGSTSAGTLVVHLGGSAAAIEANSVDEAEGNLRHQLAAGKLAPGFVYQINPPAGSTESLRALAAALNGDLRPCHLEPATGLYSEFQRIG